MPDTEPFPWDLLKAECLRLVCSQLVQGSKEGGHYQGHGRKEEMINFLRDVEAIGLEPAIQKIDTTPIPRKASGGDENADAGKRKSIDGSDEEGAGEEGDSSDLTHNTRYKGAKRVKLTKEDEEPSGSANPTPRKSGSGRPRKSTDPASADAAKRGRGRPRKSDVASKDDTKDEDGAESPSVKKTKARPKAPPPTDENGVPIKRGRGRPRKNVDAGAGAGEASPSSKGKSVFEGVVLNKRRSSVPGETSADGQAGEPPVVQHGDAADDDVVLAVINGQGTANTSNLGGSTQDNDPNSMNIDDHDADADADADGDPDPQVAITA